MLHLNNLCTNYFKSIYTNLYLCFAAWLSLAAIFFRLPHFLLLPFPGWIQRLLATFPVMSQPLTISTFHRISTTGKLVWVSQLIYLSSPSHLRSTWSPSNNRWHNGIAWIISWPCIWPFHAKHSRSMSFHVLLHFVTCIHVFFWFFLVHVYCSTSMRTWDPIQLPPPTTTCIFI
jgi:hypothetical protein